MNRSSAVRAAAMVLLGLLPQALAADSDPPVAHVGSSTLRVSDVERALSRTPSFQLRTLGDTPGAIRRRFLDTVLVPEALFDEEARERRLRDPQWMLGDLRESRRRALIEHLRAELANNEPVTDADVKKYYDANIAQFQSGPRLRLFRILVADRAQAMKILDAVRGVGGFDKWTALATEHSLDTATRLRGGELGFVRPDGSTDVPQVHVDPALYEAAARVRDGDLVQEPVPEGGRFACIWRRGSLPAVQRSIDEERGGIVQVLERERLQAALARLLERLRRQNVKDLDVALLEQLPTSGGAPEPASSIAPPTAPASSASPVPTRTERGLR